VEKRRTEKREEREREREEMWRREERGIADVECEGGSD
jgi:hypothetical protein